MIPGSGKMPCVELAARSIGSIAHRPCRSAPAWPRTQASELDLNAMLSNAIDQVEAGGGMQWVTDLHPVPKLVADREQLQSVVTNLLLNAADAVDNNGVVTVETGYENGWAQFVVADNGCGMTRDFMRKSLFRPFRTTKKKVSASECSSLK